MGVVGHYQKMFSPPSSSVRIMGPNGVDWRALVKDYYPLMKKKYKDNHYFLKKKIIYVRLFFKVFLSQGFGDL